MTAASKPNRTDAEWADVVARARGDLLAQGHEIAELRKLFAYAPATTAQAGKIIELLEKANRHLELLRARC